MIRAGVTPSPRPTVAAAPADATPGGIECARPAPSAVGEVHEWRVMIVDDHPFFRDGVGLLLGRSPGFKVVARCGDVATAWQVVEEQRPDLVVLDIDLPDGSGINLARRVTATFSTVKVVMLTSFLREDFAREAFAAGARGYLVKTSAQAELLAALRCVGAGGIYVSPAQGEAAPRVPLASPASARPELPQREEQVLRMLVRGLRNKEIAAELNLSVKTVETYRSRVMKRLACGSTAELVRCAIREGLVVP